MVGVLLGVAAELALVCRVLVPRLFGWREPIVDAFAPNTVSGLGGQLRLVLQSVQQAPFVALTALFLLLLLSVILRKDWLAAIAGWVLVTIMTPTLPGPADNPTIALFFSGLSAAIFMLGLMRFGLLTLAFAFFTWLVLFLMPLTSNFSAWFESATILVSVVLVGVAFFGFYNSLAGRPVFK
jgi:hypothetical protein